MFRLRIRRRPLVFWSLTGALALITGMVVSGAVAGAREARAGYGTARVVAVAAHDIPAGTTIGPGDTRLEERPIAVVPEGTLTKPPVGQVASAVILEGEPVVESRVAGHGLIAAGSIGIAVPLDPGTLSLAMGDRVEVLATFDPDAIDGNPTIVVAPLAIVVDVGEAAVTLSMPQPDGERVAFALSTAAVTVALLP
jgi:Flp pilus assembly protein CpaB